jgi:hypothetical protein
MAATATAEIAAAPPQKTAKEQFIELQTKGINAQTNFFLRTVRADCSCSLAFSSNMRFSIFFFFPPKYVQEFSGRYRAFRCPASPACLRLY